MKTFYDIHMHAFDLSHPNLSAFLLSFDLINKCVDEETYRLNKRRLVWEGIKLGLKNIIKNRDKNNKPLFEQVMDTLSFFEIPHEYQFLVMEYYLKACNKTDLGDKKIKIGDNCYDKIIISPLVIDFGYKNIPKQVDYSITPKYPIASQTGDMFYAIRTYYRFNMILNGAKTKFDLSDEIPNWYQGRSEKCFEIYPFMGLDTRNYDNAEDLKKLLDKYFRDFEKGQTAAERKKFLLEKMGMLDSNMYRDKQIFTEDDKTRLHAAHLASDYQYAFAGIKVYPQLGFDPYPDKSESKDLEIEKVKCLYQYCVDKRIPITTHCSDGGYKTGNNDKLTSPLTKWAKVLSDYPELTLNFAHFGSQKKGKMDWRNAIIKLMKIYKNVYTDISCNDMKKSYYDKLKEDLQSDINLRNRVLFGSDFSINLLVTNTDSYSEYIEAFAKAELPYKDNLCEINPCRFLFGKE